MTTKQEKLLRDRIEWQKQKLAAQRMPGNPDYTRNKLLIGRTQGDIGGLEWALKHLKENPE